MSLAEQSKMVRYYGIDKYKTRTLLDSDDLDEQRALWEFLARSQNLIFSNSSEIVTLPLEKPTFHIPPPEIFLKVDPFQRRKLFFHTLKRGDIFYLKLIEENTDCFKLMAIDKYKGCYKIDDLEIEMNLPKLPQELRHIPPHPFQFMIAALSSCNIKERNLLVTLDKSIVDPHYQDINLGPLYEEYVVPHLGDHFLGISYTDNLFMTGEIRRRKRLSEFSNLAIKEKTEYSHYRKSNKREFSSLLSPSSLRQRLLKATASTYYEQAINSLDQGRTRQALTHLKKALHAWNEYPEALLLVGKCFNIIGGTPYVLMHDMNVLRTFPNVTLARKRVCLKLLDCAKFHKISKNLSLARESFELAKIIDPHNQGVALFHDVNRFRPSRSMVNVDEKYEFPSPFEEEIDVGGPDPPPRTCRDKKKHHKRKSSHKKKHEKHKASKHSSSHTPHGQSKLPPPPQNRLNPLGPEGRKRFEHASIQTKFRNGNCPKEKIYPVIPSVPLSTCQQSVPSTSQIFVPQPFQTSSTSAPLETLKTLQYLAESAEREIQLRNQIQASLQDASILNTIISTTSKLISITQGLVHAPQPSVAPTNLLGQQAPTLSDPRISHDTLKILSNYQDLVNAAHSLGDQQLPNSISNLISNTQCLVNTPQSPVVSENLPGQASHLSRDLGIAPSSSKLISNTQGLVNNAPSSVPSTNLPGQQPSPQVPHRSLKLISNSQGSVKIAPAPSNVSENVPGQVSHVPRNPQVPPSTSNLLSKTQGLVSHPQSSVASTNLPGQQALILPDPRIPHGTSKILSNYQDLVKAAHSLVSQNTQGQKPNAPQSSVVSEHLPGQLHLPKNPRIHLTTSNLLPSTGTLDNTPVTGKQPRVPRKKILSNYQDLVKSTHSTLVSGNPQGQQPHLSDPLVPRYSFHLPPEDTMSQRIECTQASAILTSPQYFDSEKKSHEPDFKASSPNNPQLSGYPTAVGNSFAPWSGPNCPEGFVKAGNQIPFDDQKTPLPVHQDTIALSKLKTKYFKPLSSGVNQSDMSSKPEGKEENVTLKETLDKKAPKSENSIPPERSYRTPQRYRVSPAKKYSRSSSRRCRSPVRRDEEHSQNRRDRSPRRSRRGRSPRRHRSRSYSPRRYGRSRSRSLKRSGRSRSRSLKRSGRSRSRSVKRSGRSRSLSPVRYKRKISFVTVKREPPSPRRSRSVSPVRYRSRVSFGTAKRESPSPRRSRSVSPVRYRSKGCLVNIKREPPSPKRSSLPYSHRRELKASIAYESSSANLCQEVVSSPSISDSSPVSEYNFVSCSPLPGVEHTNLINCETPYEQSSPDDQDPEISLVGFHSRSPKWLRHVSITSKPIKQQVASSASPNHFGKKMGPVRGQWSCSVNKPNNQRGLPYPSTPGHSSGFSKSNSNRESSQSARSGSSIPVVFSQKPYV